MTRSRRLLIVASVVVSAACVSPASCRREFSSGRRKPSESELLGTWRITPESVQPAVATGLPEADLRNEYLKLESGGRCTADIFVSPCGSFQPVHRSGGEACTWSISTNQDTRHTLALAIGEGPHAFSTDLYILDDNGLKLWQYICDPDMGEFVDFVRSSSGP